MSTELEPAPTTPATNEHLVGARHRASTRPVWRRSEARLIPWLVPLVAAVLGLLAIDVPFQPIAQYGAYFGGCVVLPGVLLLRSLWRSTGNWGEDVGLGATVGMAYQLLGWALFTAVGVQSWLVVWALLVPAVFAVVPKLRPYWRIAHPDPLPVAWSWAMALSSAVLLLLTTLIVMAGHPPPPDGTSYYQDLLYHLSMVNELVRAVPPQLPQVAGVPLQYHWFPNADMAGAVDISGVSPTLVLFRLWLLPQAVVLLLVTAALARQVSKTWWAGAVAALIVLPTSSASLLSPSLSFGLVAGTAAAVFLIDALFHRAGGRGVWVLAGALALLGGGSKPTTLPILVGGVGLAALFLLIRDRRIPWRSVGAGVLLVVALGVTLLTVAGSTSGSAFQFFAVARWLTGYKLLTGDTSPPGVGGEWVLPSLTSSDGLVVTADLVLLGGLLLYQTSLVIGYGTLLSRPTRRDPAAWLLAGSLTAGLLGLLWVDHPASSEFYFARAAVISGAAASAWLLAAAFRGRSRRTVALVVAAAVPLTYLYVQVSRRVAISTTDDRSQQVWTAARPLVNVAALAVGVAVVWMLLRIRWRTLAGLGVTLPVLVLMAVPLQSLARSSYAALQTSPGAYSAPGWQVFPDEQAAALWLGENSGATDVVVTDTWCRPPGPRLGGCDARGWIVSGIAGRRALIEGWGYTQQALAENGRNGLRFMLQPSPWPDRVALSDEALHRPTRERLDHLRQQYDVRWIFADTRNGPVSPDLDRLAVLRFEQDQVKVYEIPAP